MLTVLDVSVCPNDAQRLSQSRANSIAGPDFHRPDHASLLAQHVLSLGPVARRSFRRSVRPNQAVSLLHSQVAGNLSTDVVLEAAYGRPGQWTKNAVHGSLVVMQAMQRFLHLPSTRAQKPSLAFVPVGMIPFCRQ